MKILKKYIVPLVCLITTFSFSQLAQAEIGLQEFDGMTKNISKVDKKRNTIIIGDREFSYNSSTKIVNYKNEKVTEESLRKGDFITISLDISQRYISKPVLSQIRIESDHAE